MSVHGEHDEPTATNVRVDGQPTATTDSSRTWPTRRRRRPRASIRAAQKANSCSGAPPTCVDLSAASSSPPPVFCRSTPSRAATSRTIDTRRNRRCSSRSSTNRSSDDVPLCLSLTLASCRYDDDVDFGIGDYEPLSAASDVDHSSFTSAGLLSSGCASVRSVDSPSNALCVAPSF